MMVLRLMMIIIEAFCLGVLLGTVPIVYYLIRKKIEAVTEKFNKTHSEMKEATEKLKQLHENALINYENQAKKIEKLQTEMNILKTTTTIKRAGSI